MDHVTSFEDLMPILFQIAASGTRRGGVRLCVGEGSMCVRILVYSSQVRARMFARLASCASCKHLLACQLM